MMGTNQFRCTVNSGYLTGFVSPETFDYYSHQADLSSTDGDDDYIGLVVAFAQVSGKNHALVAGVGPGGVNGFASNNHFAITHSWDNTSWQYTIIKAANGQKCFAGGSRAWSTVSPIRIKVIREGNKITVQAAPFKSIDLSAGEEIVINLDDYPELAWAKGKQPYGYCCWSQYASTYSNVEFTGAGALDANYLYDLETGDVLTFTNGRWQPNGDKIWNHLGHPRKIINPKNGKEYMIGYESITEL